MKKNQVRIRVGSHKGVLPFGRIDTKVDSKHLNKILVFVLDLMAQDELANHTTKESHYEPYKE